MSRIAYLKPLVPKADGRMVKPAAKQADPVLHTDGHRQFRDAVLARAGHRCEWVEDGQRCSKAAPAHRLFADHVRERSDGGALYDPANGQCLCGSHHTLKTAQARARRLGTA